MKTFKTILALLLMFGLVPPVYADHIVFDAAANSSGSEGQSTSHSHTIAADANLIVICSGQRDGGNAVQPADAVTVGGQAATFLEGSGIVTVRAEIWYLLNPPTGVQTVVVTGDATTDVMKSGSISFKNAALTDTFNTPGVNTTGATTGSNPDLIALASAVGELAAMCVAANAGPTCAPDATAPVSTERFEATAGGNLTTCGYTEAGAASLDMRVDLGSAQRYSVVGASIRHLATAAKPRAAVMVQ